MHPVQFTSTHTFQLMRWKYETENETTWLGRIESSMCASIKQICSLNLRISLRFIHFAYFFIAMQFLMLPLTTNQNERNKKIFSVLYENNVTANYPHAALIAWSEIAVSSNRVQCMPEKFRIYCNIAVRCQSNGRDKQREKGIKKRIFLFQFNEIFSIWTTS